MGVFVSVCVCVGACEGERHDFLCGGAVSLALGLVCREIVPTLAHNRLHVIRGGERV